MTKQKLARSCGSPKPQKRSRCSAKKQKRQCQKRQYRIRNWPDYNTALIQRGSLTLWLDQDTLQHWRSQEHTGKRGKPKTYSVQAIACCLRLGAVYHLPLAVDEETGFIHAAATTANSVSDGQVLPELLEQVQHCVGQVSADGGYDRRTCYEAIAQRNARAVIPPRRGARIWQHGNSGAARLTRDENLRRIRKVGRAEWKRESGYHRRSLAETAVFRLKALFGPLLNARKEAAQDMETLVRISALNKMTALGMPDAYPL